MQNQDSHGSETDPAATVPQSPCRGRLLWLLALLFLALTLAIVWRQWSPEVRERALADELDFPTVVRYALDYQEHRDRTGAWPGGFGWSSDLTMLTSYTQSGNRVDVYASPVDARRTFEFVLGADGKVSVRLGQP